MSEALKTLARTAALAWSLGALVYLVLMVLVEWPAFPFVFTILVSLVLVGLDVITLRQALTTGVFPVLLGSIPRDREPVWFWFSVGWWALCGLAAVGLAAYAVTRLLTE